MISQPRLGRAGRCEFNDSKKSSLTNIAIYFVESPTSGGCNPLVSQSKALVFIGSHAITFCSRWPHHEHSNERCSKPSGPFFHCSYNHSRSTFGATRTTDQQTLKIRCFTHGARRLWKLVHTKRLKNAGGNIKLFYELKSLGFRGFAVYGPSSTVPNACLSAPCRLSQSLSLRDLFVGEPCIIDGARFDHPRNQRCNDDCQQ